MTVLLAIMVITVVAIAIGYPLWRPGPQAPPDPIGPAAQLAALQERKLQLYAAIRDLGFDYRTDKLEQADYEMEVESIKAEAVAVVRRIDELRRRPPRGPDELEAEIAAFRRQHPAATMSPGPSGDAVAHEGALPAFSTPVAPSTPAAPGTKLFCTQCGAAAGPGDRFCSACGSPLRAS